MINIFKKKPTQFPKLNDFFAIQKYVWKMYQTLGLDIQDNSHYKNYFVANKNCIKLNKDNIEEKILYKNMVDLGLMIEKNGIFVLTTRGLNILKGFLLKEIKTDKIKIYEAPPIN